MCQTWAHTQKHAHIWKHSDVLKCQCICACTHRWMHMHHISKSNYTGAVGSQPYMPNGFECLHVIQCETADNKIMAMSGAFVVQPDDNVLLAWQQRANVSSAVWWFVSYDLQREQCGRAFVLSAADDWVIYAFVLLCIDEHICICLFMCVCQQICDCKCKHLC